MIVIKQGRRIQVFFFAMNLFGAVMFGPWFFGSQNVWWLLLFVVYVFNILKSARALLTKRDRVVVGQDGFSLLVDDWAARRGRWNDIQSVLRTRVGGNAKISYTDQTSFTIYNRIFGSDRQTKAFVKLV